MLRPNRILYLCSSEDETFANIEDVILGSQYFGDYILLLEYCVQDLRLLPSDVFLGNSLHFPCVNQCLVICLFIYFCVPIILSLKGICYK